MSKLYDQLKIAARERRALIERQCAQRSPVAPDARQHAPEMQPQADTVPTPRESLPGTMRARVYAHRQAIAGAVLVTGALLGAALVPRTPVSANAGANVNATPTLRLDYELRTPIPPPTGRKSGNDDATPAGRRVQRPAP